MRIAAAKFKHLGERRRVRAASHFRRQGNAASMIQNSYRAKLTRRRVRQAKERALEMDRDLCATRIQHCYRRYRTKVIKKYNQRKMASEAGRRSHLKQSLTTDLASQQSKHFFVTHVLKLQAKCRGYLARKKVDRLRTLRIANYATKIQMRLRSIRLNRRIKAREKRRRMSTMIQNIARCIQARRQLRRLQNKQLKLFRVSVEFAEKLATPDAKTVCDAYAVLTVITKGIHDGKELVIEKTTPVVHHSVARVGVRLQQPALRPQRRGRGAPDDLRRPALPGPDLPRPGAPRRVRHGSVPARLPRRSARRTGSTRRPWS